MTQNISESIVKTNEEDWAIFPFDQTSDGRRWVKLIEEIDELASKADGDTTDCGEILMEDELGEI